MPRLLLSGLHFLLLLFGRYPGKQAERIQSSSLKDHGSICLCNAKNQLLSFFCSSLWPKGYIWYSWLTGTKEFESSLTLCLCWFKWLIWSFLPTSTALSQNYATYTTTYMCTIKTPCMFLTTNHFQFFKNAEASSPSPGFLHFVLSIYNPCLISWLLLIFSNQLKYLCYFSLEFTQQSQPSLIKDIIKFHYSFLLNMNYICLLDSKIYEGSVGIILFDYQTLVTYYWNTYENTN